MNLAWVNGVDHYLLRDTDTDRLVAAVSKGPGWAIRLREYRAPDTRVPHKETSLADTKALAESLVRMRHAN